MSNDRISRWLGPLGLGLIVSIVIGFFVLSRNSPGKNASAADVVSYYQVHATRSTWAMFVVGAGVILTLFYIAGLRNVLRTANESHSWLADAAFAGGLMFSIGFAVSGFTHWALISAARNGHTTLAGDLNFLDNTIPVPMMVGLAVLATAAAGAILLGSNLPAWLGYLALVIGIVSVLGPASFAAFLAIPVWMTLFGFVLGAMSMEHEATEPRRAGWHMPTLRHH